MRLEGIGVLADASNIPPIRVLHFFNPEKEQHA